MAVVDLYVEGGPTWPGLFGGPLSRDLVLVVRNDGAAPARVVVDVTADRGRHPTGLVDVPELPPLAVGEEREFRVTVNLGAPTIGTYRVEGTVGPETIVLMVACRRTKG